MWLFVVWYWWNALNYLLILKDDNARIYSHLIFDFSYCFLYWDFQFVLKKNRIQVKFSHFYFKFNFVNLLVDKVLQRTIHRNFYGIFGIIGFVFTLGGIINYYRINPISKEERINFAIYLIICLIIGFGMCSTTGIFGF